MKSGLSLRFLLVILPSFLVLFVTGTVAQDPVAEPSGHSVAGPAEGPQDTPVPQALRILAPPSGPAAQAGETRDSAAPSTASPFATAAATYNYEFVPLSIEPIGGQTHSRAYGINALGQVAARSSNWDDVVAVAVERQAFVWDPVGGSQALPTLDGESGVWDINDDGFVSGYSFNAAVLQHAVRWDITQNPVAVTDLGTLVNETTMASGDTSTAYGLGPMGDVTGYSDIPLEPGVATFTPFHAILYSDTDGLEDLGTLSSSYPQYQNGYSISYSANSAGQVVGTAHSTEVAWHFRPFIYDAAGGLRELTRATAYATTVDEWYAVAINDAGLIGGHVIVYATGQSLPFYWPSEIVEPLPVPMPAAYPYGEIYGINTSGVMVGIMWNDLQEERAFVYDAVNGVRDLNSLVDPAEGWTLEFARDINDQGQIVGSGTIGGLARGFLLTPASVALGRVSGSVRHNLTGGAVTGALVSLYDDTGSLVLQVQTDGAGTYQSNPLFPGTYFAIAANTFGGADQLFDGQACAGCDPTTGTAIVVEAGAVAGGIDFELGATVLAAEDVAWTNLVGVSSAGNTLTKTGSTGWSNAGASSTRQIDGYGYAEFTAPAGSDYTMFGLASDDVDQSFGDIDFALYPYPATGMILVYENGVGQGTAGPYAPGDALRISVDSGVVTYWRNGTLIFTSATSPSEPLRVDSSLYSTAATVQAVLAGNLTDVPTPAAEPVAWAQKIGTSSVGNTLTKDASAGWGNAGASSTRQIDGNGYVEFTVSSDTDYTMVGLATDDADQSYGDIDFAVYPYPVTGMILVYENGVGQGAAGPYAVGDTLRISVDAGVVTYWRNDSLIFTSATPSTQPLRVDSSLYTTGASVQAILAGDVIDVPTLTAEDVVWTNVVGADAPGTTLTKTASQSWSNAGASSTRAINGDGYAEFIVPADPGYAMLGLATDDLDQSYGDIDFAFYPYPAAGLLLIYENGVGQGAAGPYAPGDTLRVSIDSGVVTYWRNGALVRTSSVSATLPLRIDTSLYSTGATVQDAKLAGALIDLP